VVWPSAGERRIDGRWADGPTADGLTADAASGKEKRPISLPNGNLRQSGKDFPGIPLPDLFIAGFTCIPLSDAVSLFYP
jgi:hypothetical protein